MGHATYPEGFRPTGHFAGARAQPVPADRIRAVTRGAHGLREELRSGPRVRFYATFDGIKVAYPTRYGLRDACSLPTPYVHILNRLFVIQFDTDAGIKTLLVEPLDRDGNAETPFFKRLAGNMGGSSGFLARQLYPTLNAIEDVLDSIGLRPEDVDYVTYDHLHTQDVRRWMGTAQSAPYFPNAKLLVTREEWSATKGLLPPQADWYPPEGTAGVPESRIIFLDDDVILGDCVALMRTPGHTAGNHSIVAHTERGLLVTSENGIAPECYAPAHSRLPGVARYARRTGMDIVLNGNTLEGALDQYISMVQEREVAGPSPLAPEFPNMVCSSELTGDWRSPGLSPTFTVGEVRLGDPVIPPRDL